MACFSGKINNRRILAIVYATPMAELDGAENKMVTVAHHNVFNALVDTGATNSCITKKAAQSINIKPKSKSYMNTAGGVVPCNVYRIGMHIPIQIAHEREKIVVSIRSFANIEVVETAPHNEYGVIIGMDVIMHGALHVSGETFTFCA